ncbi:MAG: glycerol-3-phosphate acyltransferase [Candidatus Lokiarchaeota archaeon]|nr:glycerol-3-phosphate acyltransferase [Candidatus Lokiarchaeota archaeon]
MNYLGLIGGAFGSYLFGSIPLAYISTYIIKKENITEIGSKSIGVQNAFTSGGLAAGIITVIGEISKAVVPILIAFLFFNTGFLTFIDFLLGYHNRHIAFLFVGCSFLGTNFSLFMKFKGGMGFTITIWSLLLLAPIALLIMAVTILSLTAIYRSYAKANLVMEKSKYLISLLLLVSTIWTPYWWSAFLFGLTISITYFLKRKQNLEEIRVITSRTFQPKLRKLKEYYKKNPRYVFFLEDLGKENNVGNKAKNISFLNRKGFRVPESIVITYTAFIDYQKNREDLLFHLNQELRAYIKEGIKYTVRSSANYEDTMEYSFAGQYLTFLNVTTLKELILKVSQIWDSALTSNNNVYTQILVKDKQTIKMGIVIQEMIDPQFSGVVFTRDPVYNLNEVIVEIVEGLGDILVQEGVTPECWVFKWNQWLKVPDANKVDVLEQIVKEAKKIEKKYGKPVDLEFAYDGKEIFWLQLRDITTMKHARLYSNKISKEFLPGMIKPLVFSVNIPVVNSSWKKIFRQLIGFPARQIDVDHLTKSFYYRAYFNMGVIGDIFQVVGMPRDLLEILAGIDVENVEKPKFKPSIITLRYLPRMIVFGIKLFLLSKKIEKHLRTYQKKYNILENSLHKSANIKTLFSQVDKLFKLTIRSSYLVILSQLLNSLYTGIVRKRLEKTKYSFEKINFTLLNPRIKYQDFRTSMEKIHNHFTTLSPHAQEVIKSMSYDQLSNYSEYGEFSSLISGFMLRFGFLRESGNDFSIPAWIEIPNTVLKMLINFSSPKSTNYTPVETEKIIAEVFSSPLSRFLFNRSLKYQEYRESVNQLYMYGYGLFRPFFLQIAEIFVKENMISEINDIFYLTYDEIQELASNKSMVDHYQHQIDERKKEMEKYRDIFLPEIIYDDTPPEPLSAERSNKVLKGVATSRGIYVGKVKVVKSLDDYDKIKEGDVLVIPYSDISWTPLFAKAKAVVSESGGILSHCSIVAREYKIPAVVSVNGALTLKDNTIVVVDGNSGIISVVNENITEEKNE